MSHRTCGLHAGHTRCMRRCPQHVGAAGRRCGAVKSGQLRKVLDATPAPRPFGAAICPWPEADPSRRWVRTGFGHFGRGGKAQAPPKAAQWATLGGACCLATAPRQASKAGKRRAWVGHERPLPFCTSPVHSCRAEQPCHLSSALQVHLCIHTRPKRL